MNGNQIWLVHASLALTLGIAAGAEQRVFTDVKGREIKAEMYMLRGGLVTLTRDDGKRFALPAASLSEADRTYILEWAKGLPKVKLSYRFRAVEGKIWRVGEVENANWVYDIELRNSGKAALVGIKLRYSVFKSTSGRRDGVEPGQLFVEPVVNTIDLPNVPVGKTASVTTDTFPVKKHDPVRKTGAAFAEAGTWNERLAGIRVELLHNGRVVDVKDFGRLPKEGQYKKPEED